MTASTGQRAYRNRAVYRATDRPETHAIDPKLVAKCVPLWIECAARANSRYGGRAPGNHKGRSAAMHCPDDVLRANGITFGRDRRLWAAYEAAIRRAASRSRLRIQR